MILSYIDMTRMKWVKSTFEVSPKMGLGSLRNSVSGKISKLIIDLIESFSSMIITE